MSKLKLNDNWEIDDPRDDTKISEVRSKLFKVKQERGLFLYHGGTVEAYENKVEELENELVFLEQ
jgi:hypothetical protein